MIEGHVDQNNQPVRHGFVCACGKLGVRELKDLVEHHRTAHAVPVSRLPLADDRQPSDYRPLRTRGQISYVTRWGMPVEAVAELRAIGRRSQGQL